MSTNHPMATYYSRDELERMEIDELDLMAFGVREGQQLRLSPDSIHIQYPGDLENPQALFDGNGMDWARSVRLDEPVLVSVDNEGRFCLEDGHHRWFAAGKTGRPLEAIVDAIKGKPIERILARQAQRARDELFELLSKPPNPQASGSSQKDQVLLLIDIAEDVDTPNAQGKTLFELALQNNWGQGMLWRIQSSLVANGANPMANAGCEALLAKEVVGGLHSIIDACLWQEQKGMGPRHPANGGTIFHVLAALGRSNAIKLAYDSRAQHGGLSELAQLAHITDSNGATAIHEIWQHVPEKDIEALPVRPEDELAAMSDKVHATGALMSLGVDCQANDRSGWAAHDRLLRAAQLLNEPSYDILNQWVRAETERRTLEQGTPAAHSTARGRGPAGRL